MTWTTPKDLREQLKRLWDQGELLRDQVTGHARFPMRMKIRGPASNDITERFDAVRRWVAELSSTSLLRLEWQEVHHRVQGLQRLPAAIWVESLDEALAWLGKHREWQRFSRLQEVTREQCPRLLPWLGRKPLKALELNDEWLRLLSVVNWMEKHPRPGIYLRQVDISGVQSKFIETHRAVLAELLDLALPASGIDTTRAGTAQFAARYGFMEKPARIRFRILDPTMPLIAGSSCPDITLDATSFSRLALDVQRVFITENEINFLALPAFPSAMAIFGAGYGWDALSQARWLEGCAIHYWGDIDTHGFAILDQLRGHFRHVSSFLMDRATLEAHRVFWGKEAKPQRGNLQRLTPEEMALFDDLRTDRIQEGLRLEQEHLGFAWVCERMDRVSGRTDPAETFGTPPAQSSSAEDATS